MHITRSTATPVRRINISLTAFRPRSPKRMDRNKWYNESSTETVYESGDDVYHVHYVVREHGRFSDKVPRKSSLGYQDVVEATDFNVFQPWVHIPSFGPIFNLIFLTFTPQTAHTIQPARIFKRFWFQVFIALTCT